MSDPSYRRPLPSSYRPSPQERLEGRNGYPAETPQPKYSGHKSSVWANLLFLGLILMLIGGGVYSVWGLTATAAVTRLSEIIFALVAIPFIVISVWVGRWLFLGGIVLALLMMISRSVILRFWPDSLNSGWVMWVSLASAGLIVSAGGTILWRRIARGRRGRWGS